MAKDIVMIHGANEGGWVFDQFKTAFEELGWTCHAPDLTGHGLSADKKGAALVGSAWPTTSTSLRPFSKLSHRSQLCSVTRWAVCSPSNSRQRDLPARLSW